MDGGGDGELYTMAQAARRKGVCYHTVSRAVRAGRLPTQRLGRMALIAADDLAAWRPMRERAPRRYRRREPDLGAAAAPIDAASLDRAALERRVAALAATLAEAAAGLPEAALRSLAEGLAGLAAGLRRGDG